MTRGLSVLDSYKLLKGESELTDDELFLACALGWCIEWMQGYIVLHDDIVDGSHIRRGQPCWFRIPEVFFLPQIIYVFFERLTKF
ncbi:putative transferase [Helianthus annuus]|nr:putative transferase [Helianthus annuus]